MFLLTRFVFVSTDVHRFIAAGWTWTEMSLAMGSKWASQVLFTLLVVHVAECFPTQVRALAVGTSLTMSRLGAIVAPFLNRLVSNDREEATEKLSNF